MDLSYYFMIPILEVIYKACHNYGWTLVLLTIVVRILVYPLVNSSTKNMQRMSQLQPQMKAIQEKYKSQPEVFQKKTMEFYQKNKVNPMGGCLPLLVQLPVLLALFQTFTAPPFGDKTIPVKVKVVAHAEKGKMERKEASGGNSPYLSDEGELAKVVVFPGDSTVAAGESIDFGVRAVDGKLPEGFKVKWKIADPKKANGAEINADGHAVFPKALEKGEVVVEAIVPGVAKDDSFFFISGLGKSVSGLDLLKPENWDNLSLILLFGITMFASQKLMIKPTETSNVNDEQAMIQKQTQRTMPIAMTGMFFFIPLPAGVFLYMVISNVFQSVQTVFIMRKPQEAIIDVLDDSEGGAAAGGGGKKKGSRKKSRKKK